MVNALYLTTSVHFSTTLWSRTSPVSEKLLVNNYLLHIMVCFSAHFLFSTQLYKYDLANLHKYIWHFVCPQRIRSSIRRDMANDVEHQPHRHVDLDSHFDEVNLEVILCSNCIISYWCMKSGLWLSCSFHGLIHCMYCLPSVHPSIIIWLMCLPWSLDCFDFLP